MSMKKNFLIACLLSLISCTQNDNDFLPKEITPILISKGTNFNSNYNPIKHAATFHTESEWNDFVNHTWGIATIPPAAVVNFTQFMVIVAIDKPRTTGGHSIDIFSVVEYQEKLVIVIGKLNTGEGVVTPSSTRPYHFVKIPRSNKTLIEIRMMELLD